MKPVIPFFLVAVAVSLLGSGLVYAALDKHPPKHHEHKIILCRKVEDPFQIIEVTPDKKQAGDFPYAGPPQKDALWCEDNQPGDICKNLSGLQESLPDGYALENNTCVPKVITTPAETPAASETDTKPVKQFTPSYQGK